MSLDGSIAVWCPHRPGSAGGDAEVHFNYWRLAKEPSKKGKPKPKDFIEVGVLLSEPAVIETVYIFIPEPLSRTAIVDCGPYFAQLEIAQGIFNEPLESTSAGPPGPLRIELKKNDQPYCRVHKFISDERAKSIDERHLALTLTDEGTLLCVTREAVNELCQGLPQGCPGYFRLRAYIDGSERQPFVKVISPRDRSFQSGFHEVEYIDFRLNEARTLPAHIESLMRRPGETRVPLKLVAFLTAMPVASDLTASSREAHKKRLLEHHIWDTYVPSGIPKGMMVYHWRKNPVGDGDFSAFVKMQTRRSNWKTLGVYLLLAFIFGVLGNLAASAVWKEFGLDRSLEQPMNERAQ